jgi:hypothetical protein
MLETQTMINREPVFNKPQFGAKMPLYVSRPKESDADLQRILREEAPMRGTSAPILRNAPELAPRSVEPPRNVEPMTDWSDLEAEIATFSSKQKHETQAYHQRMPDQSKSYSPAEIYDAPMHSSYEEDVPARSQRSGVKTIASIMGIALLGGLGIFGYRAFTGGASSEPKIIRATSTSAKEAVPQTQQAANRAVMERSPAGPTTVVPRDEKPLTGAQQAEQTAVYD